MVAFEAPDENADNELILQWWGNQQDAAVEQLAASIAWFWPWEIASTIVKVTPPDAIEEWRMKDPLCKQFAWYNVILYFSVARARRVNLDRNMSLPGWSECLICGSEFSQEEVPLWAFRRLGGVDSLRFCATCCKTGFFGLGTRPRCSKKSVKDYLHSLYAVSGQIPGRDFFDVAGPLVGMGSNSQAKLLKLGASRPSLECQKKQYTSHLAALIDAGVLPDGTRRTARGTQCLAADGHLCLSIGEKMIDDWLSAHGIPHDREPPWPEGRMRGDFLVGKTFIEYFGLLGDPDYDAKILLKKNMAQRHGIRLISIYPGDISHWERGKSILEKEFFR